MPVNRTQLRFIIIALLYSLYFLFNEEILYFFPGRVRIAHVPNVLHLLTAKIKMQAALEKRRQGDIAPVPASKSAFPQAESTESHTVVQTVPKGGHRVAHTPSTVGNIFIVNNRHD